MPKPKKKTMKILDGDDVPIDVEEAGLPGFLPPTEWDIQDELSISDAYREHTHDHHDDIILH